MQLTYHQFNFDGRLVKFAVAHDISEQINHQESDLNQYPKLETHKANFLLPSLDGISIIQSTSDRIREKMESVEYGFRGITKNNEIIHVNIFGSPIEYAGAPAVVGTLVDTIYNKKIVK